MPMQVRNERNAMLRTLSEKKRRHFYNQFLGQTHSVLLEEEQKAAIMHGFTDNYIKVSVLFDKEKVNQIANVTLNDFDEAGNVKATIV